MLGKEYSGFLSNSELTKLVSQYNSTIAGTKTPVGTTYPYGYAPGEFQLGDVFSSQDTRVQKTITLHERLQLRLIGEVFNVFNVEQLTNFSFNLVTPSTFGLANQRVGQTFGSGGPTRVPVSRADVVLTRPSSNLASRD